MAFPQTKLDLKIEIALGADLTDTAMSWSWTDATAYFLVSDLIVITRGRADLFSRAAPAQCRLTVINTDGRWCRTNPTGAWYGQLSKNTPLRVRVNGGSGYVTRFTGFIDELPPRWDKSGRFAYTPITASGVLRRINRGGALRSALFRATTEGVYLFESPTAPVAYWPMEDASGATSLASGVGATPMEYVDFSLGSDSSIAGSDSLPTAGTSAYLYGTVPAYASSTTWAVRWVMKVPEAPSINSGFIGWSTPGGTIIFWLFVLNSDGTYTVQGYNSALADVLGASSPAFEDQYGVSLYGRQLYGEFNATQNGSNIDWDLTVWYDTSGVGISSSVAGTIANVTDISHRASPGFTTTAGYTLGHIAISPDTAFGAGSNGATGFAGEETSIRFQRLLAEENISWGYVDITTAASTVMGPQLTQSLDRQLAEIEATEGAPIFDGFDGAVWITSRRDRQNSAVALTLDFDASQVAEAPEPTDDDQQLHNDITVSRPGGSSARATQTTGPNSTSQGVYPLSQSVNPQSDNSLRDHARWLRHLGTVDDLRFPRLDLNLARATSKITDWLACDINSRIQLTNPPSQLAPDTIDLLLEGYRETLGPYVWTVAANCSPAQPWQVMELQGSGNRGRLDTAGTTLLSGVTAGATSLTVGTTTGPKWSTSSVPYDWGIAGERVTVTAMSNVTAAFVNSGTAAHADNASVTPTMPASVQQGDLLLVFAAIRSSGTGTVNTPSGYTALLTFGNMKLLGKIHSGSEVAPTVSFAGGSAGDTCSAQMAAFRGVQALVDASTTQLNGSAQNIAVPALVGPTRPNCLILWLGWKQDDWTSVATLAGGTEIGEPSSTTGSDQGLVWDYQIQTNASQPTSTSFTVTGGASAISRSAVVALVSDVQTATVTRAVNGVSKAQTAGVSISLWKPGVLAL